jgi:hypothetical protein
MEAIGASSAAEACRSCQPGSLTFMFEAMDGFSKHSNLILSLAPGAMYPWVHHGAKLQFSKVKGQLKDVCLLAPGWKHSESIFTHLFTASISYFMMDGSDLFFPPKRFAVVFRLYQGVFFCAVGARRQFRAPWSACSPVQSRGCGLWMPPSIGIPPGCGPPAGPEAGRAQAGVQAALRRDPRDPSARQVDNGAAGQKIRKGSAFVRRGSATALQAQPPEQPNLAWSWNSMQQSSGQPRAWCDIIQSKPLHDRREPRKIVK